MSSRPALASADVRAYMSRGWQEAAELKRRHWRDALARDPLATFHATNAVWEALRDGGHTTDAAERAADLDAHCRLRTLLDRAAHAFPHR